MPFDIEPDFYLSHFRDTQPRGVAGPWEDACGPWGRPRRSGSPAGVQRSPLLAPQVDLYGFGADSRGNWHHYWENNPSAGAFRKTGVHDGDFEFNLTATLASVHKVRIFAGR